MTNQNYSNYSTNLLYQIPFLFTLTTLWINKLPSADWSTGRYPWSWFL